MCNTLATRQLLRVDLRVPFRRYQRVWHKAKSQFDRSLFCFWLLVSSCSSPCLNREQIVVVQQHQVFCRVSHSAGCCLPFRHKTIEQQFGSEKMSGARAGSHPPPPQSFFQTNKQMDSSYSPISKETRLGRLYIPEATIRKLKVVGVLLYKTRMLPGH